MITMITTTIALDSAIATTVEARRALSDLHSDYIRRMGNLGYHRIAVGEEYPSYYWSKEDTKDVPGFELLKDQAAIRCPFSIS